jgi:23S rRNA (cytidine1920-2'-O)/16S rRNA (cytidine1409-2'-O)-methyltransferase
MREEFSLPSFRSSDFVMKHKERLDRLMVEKSLTDSRRRAQALIMAGNVLVDRKPVDKPGTRVAVDAVIDIKGDEIAYVSRGGLKLEAALDAFDIDVKQRFCLDVGASTGGFTDCLLQRGAAQVFAVDVGYGQMAWKLRQDPRVTVIERENIRHMPEDLLPCPVDLGVIDVSFISLRIVVPAVLRFLRPGGTIVALIKPQFEVGKGKVGKGGVVRDPARHQEVLTELAGFFSSLGLACSAPLPSPILGTKGNREFFIRLDRYSAATSSGE